MGQVTEDGFLKQTQEEIEAEIQADVLTNVDGSLDLSANEPLGQFIIILSEREAQLNELGEQLYHMLDRDAAEDVSLDNLGFLTGTLRKPPKKTRVVAQANLNAATTLPEGSQASISGHPDQIFSLVGSVTNTFTSTSSISGTWDATDTGPIECLAGQLTVIVTPQAGWNSITNALDGVTGSDVETNTAYRASQNAELFAIGSDTIDSIRAKVLLVPGVLECIVRENDTDDPLDPDGSGTLPGHCFEVVIWDGAIPAASNDEVAQVIWDNKPGGVQAFADPSFSQTGTAIDALGAPHSVRFTRALAVNIYLALTVTPNADYVGDAALKASIVEKAVAKQLLGEDVIALFYKGLPLFFDGVEDVTSFGIDVTVSPVTTANITITNRQIAVFDTSRIAVTS